MDAAAVADPNHRSIHVTLDQQGGDAAQSTAVAPWEAAQRRMNHFVRTVALLERAGNGLGTLAFTWATVVILGGFSTNLGPDFWYATTIVFLEAFRVFSRESRSDDELLFKTTGSIRLKRVILISNVPYYLNVGIVMVSLYGTIEFLLIHYNYLIRPPHQMQFHFLLLAALLALASMVQLPTIVKYMKGHKLLQSSPLVAVLAFGGVLLWTNAPPRFAALVVAPLFVGCLQYSIIAACLQKTKILSNLPIWLQTMGTFIFPVWIAISVPIAFGCMGILVLLGTLLVGNIQVPVALARIGLSSMRLSSDNSHKIHNDENSEHLAPALKIFYSMVLGQGTLYILACICESLLFRRLRRSLARTLKVLEYKEGFQSIDLYYEHAYDKCMEDGVLAQEDLNLVRFAVDSLESNSRARKLAAVQILHSLLLGQEASNTLHVSEITTSTKAVATLISMLGWTGAEDQDIRFFAAKITAKLAGDLLIVGIPGTIQMISSLLDSGEKHYLVKQGISAEIMDINEQYNDNLQLISHGSAARVDITGVEAGYQIRAIQAISDHAVSNSEWKSKIFKFLRHIKNMLSVPREGKEPWTDDNSFPVQGMLILEKLTHDLDNCAEINRTTGLIPKIVRFINYTTNISEQKQDLIMAASLKLVARLASVEGEIGIALRRKILEQPFLLSNLVEILEESNGRLELWGPALVIIAKLAVNEETRQKIGDSQVIIPKLMQTFLCRDGSSNMYFDHVRMVAGEALSTLTKENTSYCSALLEETKYDVIEGLKNMLKEDEYAYVAASMLWNLCTHSREKLFQLELSVRLLATLPVVLEKLIDTKGNKQLESLLVLTSQLYNLNPERFAYELESHKDAKRLVQKVVSKLNSSQKPHPEYPRMRRALVEVAISIVESCPCYSTIFREVGMMEALSKVEIASLKVEKYKVFLGNASGVVVENGLHLPDLIDKAKRLIGSTTPTSTTLKPGSHA